MRFCKNRRFFFAVPDFAGAVQKTPGLTCTAQRRFFYRKFNADFSPQTQCRFYRRHSTVFTVKQKKTEYFNSRKKNGIRFTRIPVFHRLKYLSYSSSIVAGGLSVMSNRTRFMPLTSFVMRFETRLRSSCERWAYSAVMKSPVTTARSTTA